MSKSRPAVDFVILGAQRSRSTFLTECLREHPGAFVPRGEVTYFEDPYYHSAGPAGLSRRFGAAAPTAIRGFKRAELLTRSECASRIAADLPDVRLIVVLREPVERAVSAYFHYMRSNLLPVRPANLGLAQILDDRAESPRAAEIIQNSRYASHLRRYLEFFDRDSLVVLLDQDFEANSQDAIASVYRSVGLNTDYHPRSVARRINGGVYSNKRLRLLRLGSRAIYRTDPASGFTKVRNGVVPRALNRAVDTVDRVALAPLLPSRPLQLEDRVRERLVANFEADVADLEVLLGRSLEAWRAAWARPESFAEGS